MMYRILYCVMIVGLFTACSETKNTPPSTDATDTSSVSDVLVKPPLTPCLGTDECPGQVCDKRWGGCVDCYVHEQCPDGLICRHMACEEPTICDGLGSCERGKCGPGKICVDCLADSDCAAGEECVGDICRPKFPECEDFHDCDQLGAVCDEATKTCVSCTDESQCGDFERCEFGECIPDVCVPSVAFCLGDVVQICRSDGQGYFQIPCEDGKTCFEGECIHKDCEPGTTVCEGYQVKKCLPNGQLLKTPCGPGQECYEGGCVPMRHRVLVVFDTSNSMNWFPGTNEAPGMCGVEEKEDCLEAWPACEDGDNPITKLGLAKDVFGEFFQLDNKDVVFGLQRFPQFAAGESATCNGGYNTAQTKMTGDDGSLSIPLNEQTWFDEGLNEVIVVPFPVQGGPLNVFEVRSWLDFSEAVEKTDISCTSSKDCGEAPCVGQPLSKTCRKYVNPEIRAAGWTPLGKSIFYAGEYMRRHVVVDGKPCSNDGDCGSPGYYCNEAGKCFDPLRACRLNALIVFTDGVETEFQLTSEYFNPQVQAKRMRFGLGCETSADCSQLEYCVDDIEDFENYGCHPVYCHEAGYCTNEVMEKDPAGPINFVGESSSARLLDYNGNPINVLVNVVDASVDASGNVDLSHNQNRGIALNGGGVFVAVNVSDAPDFLAKLKNTTDAKQRFTLCAQNL